MCSLAGDTIDEHFAPAFRKSFPSIAKLLERSTLVRHLCTTDVHVPVNLFAPTSLVSGHLPQVASPPPCLIARATRPNFVFWGRDRDDGLGISRTRESLRAGEPQTVRRYREGGWLNARYRRGRMAMTVAARSPYSHSRWQRSSSVSEDGHLHSTPRTPLAGFPNVVGRFSWLVGGCVFVWRWTRLRWCRRIRMALS